MIQAERLWTDLVVAAIIAAMRPGPQAHNGGRGAGGDDGARRASCEALRARLATAHSLEDYRNAISLLVSAAVWTADVAAKREKSGLELQRLARGVRAQWRSDCEALGVSGMPDLE